MGNSLTNSSIGSILALLGFVRVFCICSERCSDSAPRRDRTRKAKAEGSPSFLLFPPGESQILIQNPKKDPGWEGGPRRWSEGGGAQTLLPLQHIAVFTTIPKWDPHFADGTHNLPMGP